jgi:hypothetical protein
MIDQEGRDLAQADRQIAECKEHIARQQELIWRINAVSLRRLRRACSKSCIRAFKPSRGTAS